jgi:hypothetical protein
MAIDPRQEILRMMMAQGGGGASVPPSGMMPPGGMAPPNVPPEAGLPPEVMQMAALGIRPGDLQQSNPSMRRPPDRATDEEDVDPMESYEDKQDPRFGPQDDSVRDETEGELTDVRKTMGADEDGDQDWEGDRTPTPADLEYVREHPTDGVLNSFFERFPDWTAEDILMQGGNPSSSPDQYAMDDEAWERTQSNRSTRIDER